RQFSYCQLPRPIDTASWMPPTNCYLTVTTRIAFDRAAEENAGPAVTYAPQTGGDQSPSHADAGSTRRPRPTTTVAMRLATTPSRTSATRAREMWLPSLVNAPSPDFWPGASPAGLWYACGKVIQKGKGSP